jgi:hypothetical protein
MAVGSSDAAGASDAGSAAVDASDAGSAAVGASDADGAGAVWVGPAAQPYSAGVAGCASRCSGITTVGSA